MLALKSGELTADIFQQTNEYDRELMGDLPASCDSAKMQSDEYFSKNADCYNAASSEVNDANRDAFVDGSATFSTCYSACKDVYDMTGAACLKDISDQGVQLLNKWATAADSGSFPPPEDKDAIEGSFELANTLSEEMYGTSISTLDEFLVLVDQNTIAESLRESAQAEEDLPYGDLGPLLPCVDPNDVAVTSGDAWRHSGPISNVRNKIAGLAQAYAAASVAAAVAAPPQQQQQQQDDGQAGPSNYAQQAQQIPQESLQASAGPAPKTALDAAREVVGVMANILGGGGASPSHSGDEPEPRISPLGAQLPPTQRQEQPESSARKRKQAEETRAMPPPPPPLPTQQQQQQQPPQPQLLFAQDPSFLLPTQPQHFPSGTDRTASMDIDEEGPGNQGGGDDYLVIEDSRDDSGEKDKDTTRPASPLQPADIAQLPITQPIPYGGTPPDALNKVASVQGEAMFGREEEIEEVEEEEEISPGRRALNAYLASRQQPHVEQQQEEQQEEEPEEEDLESLVSPRAKSWINTLIGFGAKLGAKTKLTSPAGSGAGGSGSGKKKAGAGAVFGSSPLGGPSRRPITEGLATAPTLAAPVGWKTDSQNMLPTQALPQSTNNNEDNDNDKLNTQETVVIDEEDDQGEDIEQQRRTRATETREMNTRDQHLATSIDARLDAGGALGGGGGGEGAASPMRPRPPFHQPSSVEGIDIEEEDGEEGGEVEEDAHGGGAGGGAGGGVVTRRGLRNAVGAAAGIAVGLVQRASSSVAQNGANAAAAAVAAAANASLGGRQNNFSAALGLGGPLTQDFYGVTATQEDIEAILGGAGTIEDAGNAAALANGNGREPSAPPAEPSRGPGNAILQGRDMSKNAAQTTQGNSLGKEPQDEQEGGEDIGAQVQTSSEKPVARRTRHRGAEEMSAGTGSGLIRGIEYVKRRKANPTAIVSKRATRATAMAADAAAAATGSTMATTEIIEGEGDEDEDMGPPEQGGGGGDEYEYPTSSMPPPPDVGHPALAAARDMPVPRGPTPAAQLPTRTLAAREKFHALMRQRQTLSASPSAAGVPEPAGVYNQHPAAAGGLRVAVHRPGGAAGVASTGGGVGSGHNSIDYRTPMAGQTPVHSVHLAAGGGRGGNIRPPQPTRIQQQQQRQQNSGVRSAAATEDIYNGLIQRRQQQQQRQQRAAASGSGANNNKNNKKAALSSLLGL